MNPDELLALRLMLSTFRDGSGQHLASINANMPDYRDFERSLAAALDGSAPENKGVFDVIVPDDPLPIGISCKMVSAPPAKHLSSFMELSNSAAAFRAHLLKLQIHWSTEPTLAGPALIELVESWHRASADEVDVAGSKYAVLTHDRRWQKWRLACFALNLRFANPRGEVEWLAEGASLNGYCMDGDRRHRLWQVYPNSGGQMKYYPLLRWAEWITPEFELEVPPIMSLRARAAEYFPDLWPSAVPTDAPLA
ncbi:hypothetical protein [Nocardioides nanhaiensis]